MTGREVEGFVLAALALTAVSYVLRTFYSIEHKLAHLIRLLGRDPENSS